MFKIGIFSNRWVFIGAVTMLSAQLAVTYLPVANGILHTAPLGLEEWLRILGVGLLCYCVVELEKWIRRPRV